MTPSIRFILFLFVISMSHKCTWNLGVEGFADRLAFDYPTTDSAFREAAEFLNAAKRGETELVKQYLDQGMDIETQEPDMLDYQRNGLMLAAANGHLKTVNLLLQRGANIDAGAGESGTTALMYAALYNQVDMVANLISKGADVNAFNNFGSNALMLAASRGYRDAVSLLMASGTDVEGKDKNNNTALILAVINNRTQIVDFLLSPRDVEIWTKFDHNLVEHAKKNNISVLGRLRRANFHTFNEHGNNAFLEAVHLGNEKMVALLINWRRSYHLLANKFGQNALTIAALNCRSSIFKTLVPSSLKKNASALPIYASCTGNHTLMNITLTQLGVSPRLRNNLGQTTLHVAAKMGHIAMVRYLLDEMSPKDVDITDGSHLNTPLMTAAQSNLTTSQAIVELLVSRGAKVNSPNFFGRAAIDFAACSGNFNVVKALLSLGSNLHSSLEAAASVGNLHLAKFLILNRGANVTTEAMQSAVIGGHFDLVKLFVERGGADKEAKSSALKMAVRAIASWKSDWIFNENITDDARCWVKIAPPSINRTEIFRFLIDNGADVHWKNGAAMFEAAKYGLTDVIRYLHYEKGAAINGTNDAEDGLNLVATGALSFKKETVKFLIELGAPRNFSAEFLCAAGCGDLVKLSALFNAGNSTTVRKQLLRNATDSKGLDALSLASLFGHFRTVRWLLKNAGFDVNNVRSSDETTPLMLASGRGHLDVLRLLAHRGADLEAVNNEGWNALRFAAENGRIQAVRLLLQFGAANRAHCKGSYRCKRGMKSAEKNETSPDAVKWIEQIPQIKPEETSSPASFPQASHLICLKSLLLIAFRFL